MPPEILRVDDPNSMTNTQTGYPREHSGDEQIQCKTFQAGNRSPMTFAQGQDRVALSIAFETGGLLERRGKVTTVG